MTLRIAFDVIPRCIVKPATRRRALRLLTLGLALCASWGVGAKTVYVDNVLGDDALDGASVALADGSGPVQTFERAVGLLEPGDLLSIAANAQPYREGLVLRLKGTPESPIVIEGNGAVIDLGRYVSPSEWTLSGAYAVIPFSQDLNKQSAFIYVHGRPIARMLSPLPEGEIAPDFTVSDAEPGHLAVRFPGGVLPGEGEAYMVSGYECVGLTGAEYITIRNLHVRGALNDGFGLHGPCVGIRVEDCSAILCGDEGASSHGKGQADFIDCLFAWNGSWSAGVTDVHETRTTYTRCVSAFGRGAAFSLRGADHRAIDCYALGNGRPHETGLAKEPSVAEYVQFIDIPDEAAAYAKVLELAATDDKMRRLRDAAQEIGWAPMDAP